MKLIKYFLLLTFSVNTSLIASQTTLIENKTLDYLLIQNIKANNCLQIDSLKSSQIENYKLQLSKKDSIEAYYKDMQEVSNFQINYKNKELDLTKKEFKKQIRKNVFTKIVAGAIVVVEAITFVKLFYK